MIRSVACGAALALGIGTLAIAQTAEEQAACQDDAFRVCSHTIPDRERTFQCMISNSDAVSPACRAVLSRFLPPEPAPQRASAPRSKKGGPRDPSSPGR